MKTKNKIIIVVASVVILGIFVIYFIPLDKRVILIKFSLSNRTGFDLTSGQLNFGAITPNHSSVRTIEIENNKDKKVNVIIKVSKEISENIIASESNFYLEPYESKIIIFIVSTDRLEEFREYNGEITILSKRI